MYWLEALGVLGACSGIHSCMDELVSVFFSTVNGTKLKMKKKREKLTD